MTAFNAEDMVERAIETALAQTWRPIEIVTVDDCSTDKTYEVLTRLATYHSELRICRNAINGGVAVSRNRILSEARGEFIAFFDDDDESLPGRVEAQVRRIQDYEERFSGGAPVLCHTARRLIYPNGREQIAPTMGQREGVMAPAGLPVAERILLGTALDNGYGACPTCSQMGRLSVFQALGGFDASFRRSEDTDLTIRLAKAGGHLIGVAQPFVVQTMTKSSDKRLADEWRYISMLLEKHRDVPDRVGLYSFCRRWIEAKQAWLEGRMIDFLAKFLSLVLTHPLRSVRRLVLALPNLALNRAFRYFHTRVEG